jgi:hypothetical protein
LLCVFAPEERGRWQYTGEEEEGVKRITGGYADTVA